MSTIDADSELFQIEEITDATAADRVAQARELLLEYGRFVVSQAGPARFCFGSLEKEAARLPLSYHEQDGGCRWREWRANLPDLSRGVGCRQASLLTLG